MLRIADLWQGLLGSTPGLPAELADRAITAVVIDSRLAGPEALFVALRGEQTDGHFYLADAFQRGAIAAIAEAKALELGLTATFVSPDGRLRVPGEGSDTAPLPLVFIASNSLTALQDLAGYWRSKTTVDVVGITGSVGKTTTKEIVANVLAQRYVTLRNPGNLNNEIGLPLTLLQLEPHHQRVVLEMGMYALGEIRRLCELARPRIGVITNVGPTHLERLGTIERIAMAKAELVQALPPAEQGGVAVLNADDHLVRAMAGLTRARVFTYGLDTTSDLWADEVSSQGLDGIRFRLHHGRETLHVHLPLLGRHSVHTALRGAAVGLVEGLSWTEIIEGLRDVRGQLRLMVVPGLRGATVIDDTYNASPASMLAALNLLHDIINSAAKRTATRRAIAVLGDMLELGSYEEEGHRLVGGRVPHCADRLIAVGSRARWIAEGALAAGMKSTDIYLANSTADAIGILQGMIRPGDLVLVKGSRALAMETIVDAISRPRAAEGG